MFADSDWVCGYEASFIHQCYFQPHNFSDTIFVFSFEAFDTVILVKGEQP